MGFGNNGLAKANLHGANDQKVLAGGDRESVGAGFTDSGYLKQLPIDVLKIDQSFIKNLPDDQDDAAIVRAIIALAYSLGLGVLAEGVETLEIQSFLISENCHSFQGYLFCKPVPPKEFQDFVEQRIN